jgi:hypothetical protein
MRAEPGQQEGQDLETATANGSHAWGQELSTGGPWHTSPVGHSPEPDAFPVDWQLSPDEDEASSAHQVSRDEEARMFQRRLLRLYRVYYPPPERP